MERNENAQHTPGPWYATFSDSGGYDCMTDAWRIEDATGGTITHVDLADYGQEYSGHDGDFPVAQANAALMAAAPELLAACVAALALLKDYRQRVFTGRIRGDLLSGDYEPTQALRAAIAKARGES